MQSDLTCCELLRHAIRRMSADSGAETRRLAERVQDWDGLLDLAHEHRISMLLHRRLPEADAAVPAEAKERLTAEYHRNLVQNMARAAELIRLLERFERESIPTMPFKGVVLASSVYGDPTARGVGDLDLLIHPRNLLRASAILRECGYELTTPIREDGFPVAPHYPECVFFRPADGMVTELRWRLDVFNSRYSRNLGMDWAWPSRQTATIAGAAVPTMNPEIMLLMLCMHGCKHVWSRLIWICDVAQLLAAHPDLDWSQVIREAKQQGLRRTLALGVLLAVRVAGAEVPAGVLRVFEAESGLPALAEYIDEHLFDDPGSTPASQVPYNMQLLDFRDRARLFLSFDYWRPNERDRAAISLPKPLYPLYYLVRPIRILLDRTPRV
jgi:hypothetical protein